MKKSANTKKKVVLKKPRAKIGNPSDYPDDKFNSAAKKFDRYTAMSFHEALDYVRTNPGSQVENFSVHKNLRPILTFDGVFLKDVSAPDCDVFYTIQKSDFDGFWYIKEIYL